MWFGMDLMLIYQKIEDHRCNVCDINLHDCDLIDQLTAPRPEGRGSPLHEAEPKPLYAIQDLQVLRVLTLPARQR